MKLRMVAQAQMMALAVALWVAPSHSPARAVAGQRSPLSAAATGQPQKVEVVDFRGIPVADVTVKLQEKTMVPLPHLVQETTVTVTGQDGTFVPPADAPAGSVLLLEKKNHAIMAYYPDRVPARVILPPAARLMGTVIDDRGVSVPHALIGPVAPPLVCEHGPADVTHSTCNPLRFTSTNEKGFFRVDGLPIHKYEFLVRAPGLQPKIVQAVTGAPFTIMVNTGGTTVTGVVLGTRDRQPQPGVYVQAVTGSGIIRLFEMTDANGRFEFGNLNNQEWVFNVYTGPTTAHHSAQAKLVPAPPEETSLTLLLNQGSSIGGVVREETTSAPMAGIALTLLGAGNSQPKMVRSGPDGTFLFTEVDALEHFTLRFDPLQYVRVLPDGSTRDYLDVDANGGQDRNEVALTLRKKAPVQGYVVDVTGAPVPDAEVKLTAEVAEKITGKEGVETATVPEIHTLTNGTGHFKSGVYPGGSYKLQARKGNLVSEIRTVDAWTTTIAAPVELRLVPAKPLAGRLLDLDDQPVTGALVAVMRSADASPTELKDHEIGQYKTARTNMDGEWTLEGLIPNHEILLKGTHPDFMQAAIGTFTPGTANTATTDQVVLRFPPGGELSVFVKDAAGKPVAGADVIAHYVEEMEGTQKRRRTNQFGLARMRSLPVQRLERLGVRHQAYADVDIAEPIPLPQKDYTVQLQRKGSITVRVQGSVEGSSGGDQPVILLQVPGSSPNSSRDGSSQPEDNLYTEQSRSLPVEGRATFPNLDPGWYKAAMMGASGFAESEAVNLKGDAANVELILHVKPGAPLHGKVTDKLSGRGIPGASVSVGPAAQYSGAEAINPRLAVTGANGEFHMPDAPGGATKVRVVAVGYPEHEEVVPASRRSTAMNVVLSNAPGGLEGSVTSNNRPVPSALMVLSSPAASETPVASALTDPNGRYHLTGFPAGQYVLSIEAPVGEGDEVTRRSQPVDVTNSSTRLDVVLPLAVPVTGTVRLNGKAPRYTDGNVPALMFMPNGGGGNSRHAKLDENGNFAVQVEPGSYSVGLEDRPGADVQVPPAGVQNLQLAY